MVLCMSRPFKHPKTGIDWCRRAVPADLRVAVGKREELRSLKTRDSQEAKRLFAEVLAEIEAKWASLRRGPSSLAERETHEIAVVVYDWYSNLHRDNLGEQTFWKSKSRHGFGHLLPASQEREDTQVWFQPCSSSNGAPNRRE